jgi:4-diphosphocytidyl-2-C-methyl-D-erythritol kinase
LLEISAPAKLNLTLEVLGRRPDGYHEIRSVMQTISLADTLRFQDSDDVRITADMTGWNPEDSLVSKAVNLVRETAGTSRGVSIQIEKRVPLLSGLAGDASDGAATLRGLNELWRLALSDEKLREVAGRLGSDAVFCLHGGTALAEGRGEIITPLPLLKGWWVVLVAPDTPIAPGKTGRMYAALRPEHFTDGAITGKLVKSLQKGERFNPAMLFNTFENVAFGDNVLRTYQEHLIKLGAPHVHLAGSGPTLFTIFQDKAGAEELYRRCLGQGMTAYLAETI